MTTPLNPAKKPSLEALPANRHFIEAMDDAGLLTPEAKRYALAWIQPPKNWGVWLSKVLLLLGTGLILASCVIMLAFYWHELHPMVQLGSIELALAGCIFATMYWSLERRCGQVSLLAASLLTGYFLVVFGQVYPTGANSHFLFLAWLILTLGWTICSRFTPQWVLWLTVVNLWLVLWWNQSLESGLSHRHWLFICLAGINGAALAYREYGAVGGNKSWLDDTWSRYPLFAGCLGGLAVSLCFFTKGIWASHSLSLNLTAALALVGHFILFGIYFRSIKDRWCVALILVSLTVVLGFALVNTVDQFFHFSSIPVSISLCFAFLGLLCGLVFLTKRIFHEMR